MIAFHTLHPFAPRPDGCVIQTRLLRIHNFTHHIPLLALRKRPSATILAGIPKAAAAPPPPPGNFNAAEALNPSIHINHKPLTAKLPKKNDTVKLASVFGLWFFQNVIFNVYNKKALTLFPYPWLIASFQLLLSSLWISTLWATKLQPFPCVNRKFLLALLCPGLLHAIGHISFCIAFTKLSVSFIQVINASEPCFSVFISALHDHFYPVHIWLSVIPIVAGCAIAAATEASFNAAGLWGALVSNACFVLRNIYSKQSFYDYKHIDGLNLYGCISIVSLFYLIPVAVAVEGHQWLQGYQTAMAAAGSPSSLYAWVLLSGVFYHLKNQTLYQALDGISCLRFSVGDAMRRVVVIIAAVIVFRNPVGPLNAVGSAMAIFGTFLYSRAISVGTKKGKKKRLMITKER